jgi:hypothetical protein
MKVQISNNPFVNSKWHNHSRNFHSSVQRQPGTVDCLPIHAHLDDICRPAGDDEPFLLILLLIELNKN